MDLPELPDDLAKLERQLAGRPRSQPEPGLRDRILDAVRRELRPNAARVATWHWAAALAAAMLFGANLAMSVANDTSWHFAPRIGAASVETEARQVRRLFPDMPEQEVYRHALLLQAGSNLPLQPAFRPAPEHLRALNQREQRELP